MIMIIPIPERPWEAGTYVPRARHSSIGWGLPRLMKYHSHRSASSIREKLSTGIEVVSLFVVKYIRMSLKNQIIYLQIQIQHRNTQVNAVTITINERATTREITTRVSSMPLFSASVYLFKPGATTNGNDK
jgi:hypothetical protein